MVLFTSYWTDGHISTPELPAREIRWRFRMVRICYWSEAGITFLRGKFLNNQFSLNWGRSEEWLLKSQPKNLPRQLSVGCSGAGSGGRWRMAVRFPVCGPGWLVISFLVKQLVQERRLCAHFWTSSVGGVYQTIGTADLGLGNEDWLYVGITYIHVTEVPKMWFPKRTYRKRRSTRVEERRIRKGNKVLMARNWRGGAEN